MKKLLFFIALSTFIFSANAQIKIGGKSLNTKKLVGAASDLATAITLSDEDVANLCKESVEWMDTHNKVSDNDSPYTQRLNKLTENLKEVNGIKLNFKVYEVIDINAFACGDGSIRVFSSLMDIMDDDELLAIIGHEIGHIAGTDTKDAIKRAYLASAAAKAAGSAGGAMEKLSESQLGEIAQSFVSAKFSQKQEYAADEYGFKVCIENGRSPYGMTNALNKLVELSNGEKASVIQQMFSSHPDSEKRAAKMKEKADKYTAENK